MKITKQRLKDIIREELKSIKEELNSKQQLNEGTRLGGIWKGLRTRESGLHCINGKTEKFATHGTGTIFSQFLWLISPKKGYLQSSAIDSEGNINKKHNYAIMDGWGDKSVFNFYWNNKGEGMDIKPYVPIYNAYKMNKDYQSLSLNTKLKMAHGDHKLATRFLAKYGIKPNIGLRK